MHKMLDVGLLQPAAVTIYEYYSPDARCTKFYHPERTDGEIYRLCTGDLCECAEGDCTYQKKNRVDENQRSDKACEPGMDYVYKLKVKNTNLTQESDTYDMEVESVLKLGTDEEVAGKTRQFLARPNCREHLGLEKDKSYLVMGKFSDLGKSLQYVFGEQTWVEYWPTEEESQTQKFFDRYNSINKLQKTLENYGCPK
ncbi:complement C3-like [Labeo rohita]|nr:complement C3-like [Labeo rohita]